MDNVHVFIDNSNIWIMARMISEKRDGLLAAKDFRLHLPNLKMLAGCNRPSAKFMVFSSRATYKNKQLWVSDNDDSLTETNFERGMFSGTEQAVDDAIQLAMYKTMAAEEPGVVVLLTGDGKGFDEGVGFTQALYDMHRRGWGVEVLSWEQSCHHELREFAEQNGVFVPLDEYFEQITYVQNERDAKPLSLKRRKMAAPDITKSSALRIRLMQRKISELEDSLNNALAEIDRMKSDYGEVLKNLSKKEKGRKRYEKARKIPEKSPFVKKDETKNLLSENEPHRLPYAPLRPSYDYSPICIDFASLDNLPSLDLF